MRRVFVTLVLLASCGSSKPKGPAWPAPSTTAEDGGESIAPRPGASYAAAVEKSAEPEPEEKSGDEEPAATDETANEDTSAATPEADESSEDGDDVMTGEEIIIEIEEE